MDTKTFVGAFCYREIGEGMAQSTIRKMLVILPDDTKLLPITTASDTYSVYGFMNVDELERSGLMQDEVMEFVLAHIGESEQGSDVFDLKGSLLYIEPPSQVDFDISSDF